MDYPPPTPELIDRLLAEDSAAWTQLVRSHSGLLLEVARRVGHRYGFHLDPADLEDIVAAVWQNLLDKDYRQLRRCREQDNLLPTLVTLTRNRAVDLMRRHRLPEVPLTEELEAAAPQEEAGPPPEAGVRALASLNPRERTLVELFYLQKKKYREISELTGIAQNSIGPTLQRALDKMRALMTRQPD